MAGSVEGSAVVQVLSRRSWASRGIMAYQPHPHAQAEVASAARVPSIRRGYHRGDIAALPHAHAATGWCWCISAYWYKYECE